MIERIEVSEEKVPGLPFKFRGVIFPEQGMYVVVFLDRYFASCADTREELLANLAEHMRDQVACDKEHGHDPFWAFKAAPRKIWKKWEEAEGRAELP